LIEQLGAPSAIYQRPATRFVLEFIGNADRVGGRALEAAPRGRAMPHPPWRGVASIRTDVALTSGQKVAVMFQTKRAAVSDNPAARLVFPD